MYKELGIICLFSGAVLGAVDVATLGLDIPGDAIAAGLVAGGLILTQVSE